MEARALVAAQNIVTLRDVAAKAGVPYNTARNAMYGKSCAKRTVDKVRAAAATLGYDKEMARHARGRRLHTPTNVVFKTREEETGAMRNFRAKGFSNDEISKKCGVSLNTVWRRIGAQPSAITTANRKLCARIRSTKTKIRNMYMQQQTVAQYNELAAQLNKKLEEAQKVANQLSVIQKKAQKASTAIKVPLTLIHGGAGK